MSYGTRGVVPDAIRAWTASAVARVNARNPASKATTVRRRGLQYIEDAVGSALAGLSAEEREDMHLSVFFANADPTTHPTFHQPWLRELVDSVEHYEAGTDGFVLVIRVRVLSGCRFYTDSWGNLAFVVNEDEKSIAF